jgi:hypothetical protein
MDPTLLPAFLLLLPSSFSPLHALTIFIMHLLDIDLETHISELDISIHLAAKPTTYALYLSAHEEHQQLYIL